MGTEQILFGASVIVAFLSGMVALFAPCCITFLLPAYIGQILRARVKILLGTVIFGLGIATVMLPIALGFRVLVNIFSEFHTTTYVIGGLMMIFFGIWTLLGKKINFPFAHSAKISNKIDKGSLYALGVFSGITSACCAPVLAGALMLAGFSATLFKTIIVGFSYVAGMVFPLLIGALLWESNPLMPLRSFLAKSIRPGISLGSLISGIAFIAFGLLLALLALVGKIAMPESGSRTGAVMGSIVIKIGGFLKNYGFIEYVFLVMLIAVVILLVRKLKRG
ncbi:MAG: cytochrome c biogenesis protein CcdA [Candidatus Nealsonbacteria bacterium]|nr:cytochrome c biogenesis protein CcdA [Candidatus Nealsonbacteria bacterium]